MYWHYETDIISVVLLIMMLTAAHHKLDRARCRDRVFMMCLTVGVLSALLDMADALLSPQLQPSAMLLVRTLYYMGVLLPICLWFAYTIAVVFEGEAKRRDRAFKVVALVYFAYIVFLLVNFFTGAAFYYDEAGNYFHAPLYPLPLVLGLLLALSAYVLLLSNRGNVRERRLRLCLLVLPPVLALGILLELRNPGWLMFTPCYMLALFAAFNFIQNQQSQTIINQLETEADTDDLTGLLNRSAVKKRVDGFIQSDEYGCCALIIADMDNLKRVNDTLGHPYGDVALKLLSDTFRAHFRATDTVGRLGGDEFVIFLPQLADKAALKRIIEKLMAQLEGNFVGDDNSLPVRCSIGAVAAQNRGESFESLYLCADKALYAAKYSGKSRYEIYDPPED